MTGEAGGEGLPESAQNERNPGRSRNGADKEVAGALVAAIGLAALVAIVLIAILSLPGDGKPQNIVAIASSAFGVIGAVVGAYFGIRTAKNAVDQVRDSH
jgi:amino acid transporter